MHLRHRPLTQRLVRRILLADRVDVLSAFRVGIAGIFRQVSAYTVLPRLVVTESSHISVGTPSSLILSLFLPNSRYRCLLAMRLLHEQLCSLGEPSNAYCLAQHSPMTCYLADSDRCCSSCYGLLELSGKCNIPSQSVQRSDGKCRTYPAGLLSDCGTGTKYE